ALPILTELEGSRALFSPRWSPNGRYIAAISADGEALEVFDFSSQKWTQLVKLRMGYPNWSQDSQYIYFDSYPAEGQAFYRVRISDHKLDRFVSLKNIRRAGFYRWTGLAPDNLPLLLRYV